jgi:hypothetical protein
MPATLWLADASKSPLKSGVAAAAAPARG